MKKNALRKFLGIYHLIQDDVKEERTETVIQLYGRKKKICIPEWFFKIEDVFQQILSVDENEIVKEIIEKVYRKGADDKVLLSACYGKRILQVKTKTGRENIRIVYCAGRCNAG